MKQCNRWFYNKPGYNTDSKRVATLHILPQTPSEKQRAFNFTIIGTVFFIMISFGFVSIFGLVFIVFEKESEVKLHQFINSVEIRVYWLTNLAWDAFMYCFPVLSNL